MEEGKTLGVDHFPSLIEIVLTHASKTGRRSSGHLTVSDVLGCLFLSDLYSDSLEPFPSCHNNGLAVP